VRVLAANIAPPSRHFSGHETFPLRQLWLRKAYDGVRETKGNQVFTGEDAIARFGVGKNMVGAIRHWALACEFIEEDPKTGFSPTLLANQILGQDGLDPFCEHPTTAWLVHWKLAGVGKRSTTWWWLFNAVVAQSFDKESLASSLIRLFCRDGERISESTISRDVDVCLSSYVQRSNSATFSEDAAEPILAELPLLHHSASDRRSYTFRRGPKPTLSDSLFAYTLIDYWNRIGGHSSVLAFERVAHGYGSPGRVFKFDENAVADRLLRIEAITSGDVRWTDNSGLKQIARSREQFSARVLAKLLEDAYA
jgi:hypothetical protein